MPRVDVARVIDERLGDYMDFNLELTKERFLAIHDDLKKKLINGALLRKQMWDSLKKTGQTFEGDYRYPWIKSSSESLRDFLLDIAVQFNHEHPDDDRASIRDIIDILNMTTSFYEDQIKIEIKKKEDEQKD
jgi:frataxin-like iron-binding protein CyaY